MRLFHASDRQIPSPDIRRGRKNADFGQGFYLTPDEGFARRWGRGETVWINVYDLDTEGLRILRLERDADWLGYIADNRAAAPDRREAFDVIAGPVANDTIFDTWGIVTGGFITRRQGLELLRLGPRYEQWALKTDRAAARLAFLEARLLTPEELAMARAPFEAEQEAFQRAFAKRLEELMEG